jgi:histone arginine demethylase JMJD6
MATFCRNAFVFNYLQYGLGRQHELAYVCPQRNGGFETPGAKSVTSRSTVERLSADTAYGDVFQRMRAGQPFILTGLAVGWKAIDKWSPDFLSEYYGSEPVEFARCGTKERVQRRLADYFALSEVEKSNWYLVDWDFRRRCPELLHDFSIPQYFSIDWLNDVPSRRRPDLMWIYVGHAGTFGPNHIDNFGSSAWLAVLQGTKHVAFPTLSSGVSSAASIDAFGAGEDPRVRHFADAVLGPGDVLFVPAGAWHAAMNETYCLSVTANFIDGTNFGHHRKFAMREWFGPLMLASQVGHLSPATDSLENQQLRLQIHEALRAYRAALADEIAFVEQIHLKLSE